MTIFVLDERSKTSEKYCYYQYASNFLLKMFYTLCFSAFSVYNCKYVAGLEKLCAYSCMYENVLESTQKTCMQILRFL